MTYSPNHRPRPARTTGFTLLEMLVVLVLIGMLTALVAQALGGLGAIDASLERAEQRLQADFLAEHQLRQLGAGLVPDPNLDNAFAGDSSSFTGLSLASLAARPGVPMPVRLAIEPAPEDSELVLHGKRPASGVVGGGEWVPLQRWALGPGDWAWRYRDRDGRWQPAWPDTEPETAADPQLPRGLALVNAATDTPRWLLAVPAHPTPRPEFWPAE